MKRLTLLLLIVLWGTAVSPLFIQYSQAKPVGEVMLPAISQNLELVNHVGGEALTLTVQGDYLYTVFGSRLTIFDATDEANPQEVGRLMLTTDWWIWIQVMAVWGDELFLIAGDSLYIAHVGDPTSPYLMTKFQLQRSWPSGRMTPYGLVVRDDYLYIAFEENVFEPVYQRQSGIAFIDLANLAQPVQRATVFWQDESLQRDPFVIIEDHLAMATEFEEMGLLRIIDITDKSQPVVVGEYTDEELYPIGSLAEVAGNVVLSTNYRFYIIDISDPAMPTAVSIAYSPAVGAQNLAIKNSYAYMLTNDEMYIVDFLDPLQPGQTFTTTLPYSGNYMVVTEDALYLSTGHHTQPSGFNIFQLDSPTAPMLVGSYQEPLSTAPLVAINGVADQLYVQTDYDDNYRLAREDWTELDELPANFSPQVMVDEIAFSPDMSIYDLSNPAFPAQIGAEAVGGEVLAVAGDYAYIGTPIFWYDNAYLRIVDISDYARPTYVSEAPVWPGVSAIFVVENYVYVPVTAGLAIFDVSDPAVPTEVAIYPLVGSAMALYGQYALVATADRLHVLDLSDPSIPVAVGDYPLHFGDGWSMEIVVQEERAFVVSGQTGVEVWDVSDVVQPVLVGFYNADVSDVVVLGEDIYGVGWGGLFHWRWLMDERTAVLPSSGGNLTTTDGKTTFSFGDETLTDTVQVDYRALNRPNNQGDLWGMNRFFEVTAVYSTTHQPVTTFANPYTITLTYADTDAAIEESLALYFWDGTQWVIEPGSTLNSNQQTVTATPTRLGRFALLGQTNQVHLPTVWHNGNLDDTRLVLRLNEPASANHFNDGSGYAHHGSCTQGNCPMAGVDGVRGTAVQFDGLNDVIGLGNPPELRAIRQEITIAAWVRPASDQGIQNVVAHGYSSQPQGETFLRIDNGRYEIGSWDGTDHLASFPIPPEDIGQWVHLVGVYDGAAWRLYRNGVEVSMATDETGAVFVYEDWAVGANGSGDGRFFQGSIDEVVIYNRGLSAAEVTNLYESYLSQ